MTSVDSGSSSGSSAPSAPLTPEQIVDQLRALRQQIPDYMQLPLADSVTMRRAANANPDFVQATINALDTSPAIQSALGTTAEVQRQETTDAARCTAVEDELRAMLKGVIATNLTRRHRVGLTALETYSISRQLVRQKEHADLLPHVQEMQRLNRFGRGRRKASTPATVPTADVHE